MLMFVNALGKVPFSSRVKNDKINPQDNFSMFPRETSILHRRSQSPCEPHANFHMLAGYCKTKEVVTQDRASCQWSMGEQHAFCYVHVHGRPALPYVLPMQEMQNAFKSQMNATQCRPITPFPETPSQWGRDVVLHPELLTLLSEAHFGCIFTLQHGWL